MSKHWIKYTLFGNEYITRLGDIVWFYPGCSMSNSPQVAIITSIGEDCMVDLSVVNTDVARKINQRGICLINTMVLMNNKVHQNKGCWCPQTPVDLIKMSPETEG
jgi:hypothetical protein